MEFKILFVCFVVMLHRVRCQECRVVSVFNDKDGISNSGESLNVLCTGPQGERGDRGSPGKSGFPGLQGPPGKNGSQGVQGLPGIDGSAGIQGMRGEKGIQGVQGLPGIDGATGIQGPQGEKGIQGVQGLPGIDGSVGIQGPRGEKGIQGVQGLPGIDGAVGIQGLPGMKGNQGVKGESGSTDGIATFQQKIGNLVNEFRYSLSRLQSEQDAVSLKLERPLTCWQSNENGVQTLRSGESVYCHQHWHVIQRRFNGAYTFHTKNWNEYKNGFGSLSDGEFWIGLDEIYRLTRNGGCRLRIEMGAFDGSEVYAEYRQFSIGSESDLFRLHISGYSGTAGDSIIGNGDNNNMPFTTVDIDNDGWSGANCARHDDGRGGWWHNNCGGSALNGRWGENLRCSLMWWAWKGCTTLKSTMMMLRYD